MSNSKTEIQFPIRNHWPGEAINIDDSDNDSDNVKFKLESGSYKSGQIEFLDFWKIDFSIRIKFNSPSQTKLISIRTSVPELEFFSIYLTDCIVGLQCHDFICNPTQNKHLKLVEVQVCLPDQSYITDISIIYEQGKITLTNDTYQAVKDVANHVSHRI